MLLKHFEEAAELYANAFKVFTEERQNVHKGCQSVEARRIFSFDFSYKLAV